MSGKWLDRLGSAVRYAASNPRQFVSGIIGKGSRSLVYSVRLENLPPRAPDALLEGRALSDAELRAFPYDGNPQRLERLGSGRAHGVFVGGRLAHVSWLVTCDIEPTTGNVIRLRDDEVEITACFTVPEFRGHGLYPRAIRQICEIARQKGFRSVFMKVRPENESSRRGVVKAGLTWVGAVYEWSSPLLPKGGIVLRGHRLPRLRRPRQESPRSGDL